MATTPSQALRPRRPLQLARLALRPLVVALAATCIWALSGGAFTALSRQPHLSRGLGGARGALGGDQEGEPSLESAKGIDYVPLRDLLRAGDFKGADAETRRLLIVMAGEAAVKRGWVYFAEVKGIPESDFNTVDSLWQYHSQGKFGFVVQKKIWKQCREQFDKFAEQVSWFTDKWKNRNWPDEFVYSLEAPVGHLPLTNCIRGAQVLQELLAHPALEKKKAMAAPAPAPAPSSSGSADPPKEKKSALSMLAFLGCAVGAVSVTLAARGAFAGTSAPKKQAFGAVRTSARATAVETEAAPVATFTKLADLKELPVINEHGLVLPEVPEGSKASVFVIMDAQHKAQYLGFSKDLRNTLRTLLCRRPELCYNYKCEHLSAADNAPLLQLRNAWIEELGALPPGNKEQRQKALWESPVDAGAVSARAYRTVAEQKAKQVLRQLKDRGLKEAVEFKDDLLDKGQVDAVPSALSSDALLQHQEVLSSRTSRVERFVNGKEVSFELFYAAELVTKGGWWFDVEVSASKQKSAHRMIVGKDVLGALGASEPKEVVEAAFAVLLARRVPRQTEGLITSEVFPINYFTASNVAARFPEFLELFGKDPATFDLESAQWSFKQVHDYSQDDKRTIPAGPMGGYFDPTAFQ